MSCRYCLHANRPADSETSRKILDLFPFGHDSGDCPEKGNMVLWGSRVKESEMVKYSPKREMDSDYILGSMTHRDPVYGELDRERRLPVSGEAPPFEPPVHPPREKKVDPALLLLAATPDHSAAMTHNDSLVGCFAGSKISGFRDDIGRRARFQGPSGMACDPKGNLYVCDTANHVIRKVSPRGAVLLLAGTVGMLGFADGEGLKALFNQPSGICFCAFDGALYVADTGNHAIRRITVTDGKATTVSGARGIQGLTPDDEPGMTAEFSWPMGVAAHPSPSVGSIFVSDTDNHCIRKVDITEMGPSLALAERIVQVEVEVSSAELKMKQATTDRENAEEIAQRVRDVAHLELATASLAAEQVKKHAYDDLRAELNKLQDDYDRILSRQGRTQVYAGGGFGDDPDELFQDELHELQEELGDGDGGGFLDARGGSARFNKPAGLSVDGSGYVYVADSGNDRIRCINTDRVVTTIIGGRFSGDAIGRKPGLAMLNGPLDVMVSHEPHGDKSIRTRLYYSDTWNHNVKMLQLPYGGGPARVVKVAGGPRPRVLRTEKGTLSLDPISTKSGMPATAAGYTGVHADLGYMHDTLAGGHPTVYDEPEEDAAGSDPNKPIITLRCPNGLALHQDHLYVVDSGNTCVRLLTQALRYDVHDI